MSYGSAFSKLVLCALGLSCLPGDTRPVPVQIDVTVSSTDLVLNGIPSSATADGWNVSFERLLISIGDPHVGSPLEGACSPYSNPGYARIFDMKAVTRPENVGVAFARDQCSFSFTVSNPEPDTKIAAGATDQDRELMRTPGTDPYAGVSGISMYVSGTAERAGMGKRFAWAFRQRVRYEECWQEEAGTRSDGLDLRDGEIVTANIEVRGEDLFRDHLDPSGAMLRFDVFASADANSDGEVTLSELRAVPLEEVRTNGPYGVPDDEAASSTPTSCTYSEDPGVLHPISTLGDYVYCGLFPQLVRFDKGGCQVTVGEQHLQ
jgi:hypothetical protein